MAHTARTLALAVTALACTTGLAAPIEGVWEVRFACPHKRAAACRASPESFSLRLRVAGRTVCGMHSAMAQLGNRVDEAGGEAPSLRGTTNGRQAEVAFTSAFGGQGQAELRLRRGRLHWQITHQEAGESWLPQRAMLRRSGHSNWPADLRCGGPSQPAP